MPFAPVIDDERTLKLPFEIKISQVYLEFSKMKRGRLRKEILNVLGRIKLKYGLIRVP